LKNTATRSGHRSLIDPCALNGPIISSVWRF
jgi:hypothetical protein